MTRSRIGQKERRGDFVGFEKNEIHSWRGNRGSRRSLPEACDYESPKIAGELERVDGIEPTIPLWKRGVLPLNYTRKALGSVSSLLPGGQASVQRVSYTGVLPNVG
jgi:hypothetical protein